MAVGDFDENDTTDVLIANTSDGVQWHPGTGDGQFLPHQDLTPGELTWWVVVEDFNGDGHEDVASLGNQLLRILLGHGDGTFTSAGTIDVPDGGLRGVSGDLNDDGNPDLVVLLFYDPYVLVLLGNGDGTFQPPQQYAVPEGAYAAAIGELTGDDKPDLAIGHAGDSSAISTVLPGTGGGSFGPAEIYENGGDGAASVVIADVDRDGHGDFLKGTWWGPLVLLNRGDGTFPSPVTSDVDSGGSPPTVDDLDDDGALDLAVAPEPTEPGTIAIMLGGGDGSFVLADQVGTGGESHSAIVAAELGQGVFKDLASADELSNAVRVYPGLGAGMFGAGASLPVGASPRSLAAGDLDGDDDVDLVTGNWMGADVSVLLQESDGFAPEARYATVIRPVDVALGFVDGDANLDLVVLSSVPSSSAFAVQLGSGDGSFGSPMLQLFDVTGFEPYSMTLVDLDEDGELDVVVVVAKRENSVLPRGRRRELSRTD